MLCVGRHKKQKSELPKQLAEKIHKTSSELADTAKSPMTMHTATATIHHIDFCSASSHSANCPFSKNPSPN